jgi:hypothetical protein
MDKPEIELDRRRKPIGSVPFGSARGSDTRVHNTRNLSQTLEDLLQDFVKRERAQRRAEDTAIDQLIDRLNAFHRVHGLLSDEFSSLHSMAQFDTVTVRRFKPIRR